MASKILMPNPNNINYVSISAPFPKPSHLSSGQIFHLPKKEETSTITSVTVPVPSVKTTKNTNNRVIISGRSMLSHFWREIQGVNSWENLVEPLHPLLRQEIIRYGEFVTACYKAFDLDPNSKRYLNCKYGKKNMFTEVGMPDSGYHVTKYIYATPEVINMHGAAAASSCGRWIGYVAVSNDQESVRRFGRRDIVIGFRGTVTNPEWIANMMSSLTPARLDPHNPRPDVKVESGFLSLYTSDESSFSKFGVGSCREQLLSEISRLLNKYKGEELSITIAGHSMGSSIALLLAYDISELGLNKNTSNGNKKTPVTVFSYGGPRVGNKGFKDRIGELGVKVLRIVNANDPITKLPGVVFNENFFRVLGNIGRKNDGFFTDNCYSHVGVELLLDFFNVQNPTCVHDLDSYINLLRYPKIRDDDHRRKIHDNQSDFDGLHVNHFLEKARKLLGASTQNLNVLPLRDAANNMVISLVQSQRT